MSNSRTRFLNVLPNPYHALDDLGEPAGLCHVDPLVNPRREFVGARLVSAEVIDSFKAGDLRNPRQYNTWAFDTVNPTRVERTDYYIEKLRGGELIAFDEQTSKEAGFPRHNDPQSVLSVAMLDASNKWTQMYGEPPAFWVRETVTLKPEQIEEFHDELEKGTSFEELKEKFETKSEDPKVSETKKDGVLR